MFTMFEAVLFVSCIMLSILLAFLSGFCHGAESVKKRVFKQMQDKSDPWDCLDAIREEVAGK